MSLVISSPHTKAPTSPTMPTPGVFFPFQSEIIAPCGSATTAIRPASITSKGSIASIPPSDFAWAALASTSSVATYGIQFDGIPRFIMSGIILVIAATSCPWSCSIR